MNQLRVLHVIPSVSTRHGGPSAAIRLFGQALTKRGVRITIATTDDDGPGTRLNVPLQQLVAEPDGTMYIHFRRNTGFYKTSWTLARWLRLHVADYDAVHIHALFSFSSFTAARAARRAGVPYVVRPLGALNRWGLENRRRVLKQWSLKWVERPILRGAAAIHYTAEAERQEAAAAHPEIGSLPSVIIPVPIESDATGNPAEFYAHHPSAVGRPIILFLSRLDPKKGIELLLEAFQVVRRKPSNALLVIAGKGHVNYRKTLEQRAEALGMAADVLWTGFLEGERKTSAFAAATMFVLPSYSENFGIAAAEALAHGLPTILTSQVALADSVLGADAGLVVPAAKEPLAMAMERLLDEPETCLKLSRNAKELVRAHFSLASVGGALHNLYSNILERQATHG